MRDAIAQLLFDVIAAETPAERIDVMMRVKALGDALEALYAYNQGEGDVHGDKGCDAMEAAEEALGCAPAPEEG